NEPAPAPIPIAGQIVEPPPAPPPVATRDRTIALSHNRDGASLVDADEDVPHSRPRRVNRGYKIREDLVKALKRVALDEDRKLFELMEEAFERYLTSKPG